MIAPAIAATPACVRQPRFAGLGRAFHSAVLPAPLPEPYWVSRNARLAVELGIDPEWLEGDQALQIFSGNALLPGSQPLASVYSGHQFGSWAGQLGDGRALLLGETESGQELQLKGSGRTPYSRMADGRAVLRSSIREFLASEALHALGIPTTRALCITGSDLPVRRETLETAAVLTRVAPSFIRFGHFEHFSHTGQHDELRHLADHVIEHHHPQCAAASQPYAALLQAVTCCTARLLAQWQAVGFMHGVMNTDNMSILGLTIDYGPFQFMDGFDPKHICNHSDHTGRYAFDRQPDIARWNLHALALALMPLIGESPLALAALQPFDAVFEQAFGQHIAAKLGFAQATPASKGLAGELLVLLARERTDYPIFWRRLSRHMAGQEDQPVHQLFIDRSAFERWMCGYLAVISQDPHAHSPGRMLASNPHIVLRQHLAEQAIARARGKDFSLLAELLAVLQNPYQDHPDHPDWAHFPPDWAAQIRISCSS